VEGREREEFGWVKEVGVDEEDREGEGGKGRIRGK